MSAIFNPASKNGDAVPRDCLISVVTVSLNAAKTIEDTLASVAMQAAEFRIEHICVDGGSRDGTRDIIDRWAQSRASLRRVYEADTGIFDAMNKGLRAARGEYVLFLNADDFLASEDSLAVALQGIHPGSDDNPNLITCHVSMGRLGTVGFWRHRRVPRLLGRLPGLFAVHQGVLAQRWILQRAGGFNPDLRLASDVTLYYDLERNFPLTTRRVNEDLTFMRAGGAANAALSAIVLGSSEIFRHLLPVHGYAKATLMVMVKTLQSLSELRFGRCRRSRWFSEPKSIPPSPTPTR